MSFEIELPCIEEFLYKEQYVGVKLIEAPPFDIKMYELPRQKANNFIHNNCDLFSSKSVVYILFNKDLTDDGKREIYIGKTSDISSRFKNHNANKTFWTNALVFSSSFFSESAILYLENKITALANGNSLLEVKTQSTQKCGQIRPRDLETYDRYLKIILELLRVRNYWPQGSDQDGELQHSNLNDSDAQVFYLTSAKFKDAQKLLVIGDTYRIKAGTKISLNETPSFTTHPSYRKNLDLIEKGIISREKGIFLKDYDFDSPSLPASIILGNSTSGPANWKNEAGIAMKDLEL